MAERVIQKSLAGRQDILFGHGQVDQTRAGGVYTVDKVSMVWVCKTHAELLTLDTTQFTQATVNYQGAVTHWGWTGTHWYCQETDMTLVGSFEAGFTYTAANQVGCTASGIYSWSGNLPHAVTLGTNPAASGSGYVPRTDMVLRAEIAPSVFEALRRSYADARLIVKGYTRDGVTLTSTDDVVIHNFSGKGYSWSGAYPGGGYIVTPGTDPTLDVNFVDRSADLPSNEDPPSSELMSAVYVNSATGVDTNPGTALLPVATWATAYGRCAANGTIYVQNEAVTASGITIDKNIKVSVDFASIFTVYDVVVSTGVTLQVIGTGRINLTGWRGFVQTAGSIVKIGDGIRIDLQSTDANACVCYMQGGCQCDFGNLGSYLTSVATARIARGVSGGINIVGVSVQANAATSTMRVLADACKIVVMSVPTDIALAVANNGSAVRV